MPPRSAKPGMKGFKRHVGEMTFLLKDTTEMTLESKKFLVVGDPFGQPPDIGGLEDYVCSGGSRVKQVYLGL
ncbi:hypothetical protein Tco_1454081 [Tanacetum coccineum]